MLWGQVRPGSGWQPYRLRVKVGRRWSWVGSTRRANARGFFTLRVVAPRGAYVQLYADGAFGPPLRVQ